MTESDDAIEIESVPHRVAGLGWMLALFFVSGISGLIYEIIWLRKLTLIFGNTALAVSTVLAAYMAGLGLGSLLLGRLVETRGRRPILWYVWLEAGICVFALASLPMLDAFGPLYVWLYRKLGATWHVMSLVRLACAFVALLPPTFLMGGTLPVLCRQFVRDDEALGPVVAKLYGINTLGAVAGCFAASFVLIGLFGSRATLHVGAVLNLFAAAGAWALSRHVAARAPDAPAGLAEEAPASVESASPGLLLLVAALCGFCGLAYESFWTRLLSHIVGLDVQAFGLMLCTFLLGIGLGSVLVARSRTAREKPLAVLIAMEVLIGCFALLSVAVFANIDMVWWALATALSSRSLVARTAMRFGQCVAVMAMPALFMGAAFPLLTRLYVGARHEVGRGVGLVYAWNTFGSIAGSLAAGFALMPLLGTNVSLIVVGLVNVGMGAALLLPRLDVLRAGRARGAAIVLAVCVGASVWAAVDSAGLPPVFSVKPATEFKVVWHGEDIAGSVCVLESREDEAKREVNINGMSVAYMEYDDICVQKQLAHLPLLIHNAPKDVLIVGFGSGSTSGTTMLYPVRTECIELQRLERVTAQFFTELNHRVLDNSRFTMQFNDGRNFLFLTPKRFDVISRDTLPPKESQNLFSAEFYKLCKARLRPGGVVCGFLPTNLCPDAAYFLMLVRTFQSVFPEASLWYVGPECCLLVGQREPLAIDYAQFCRRIAQPAIQADLAKIHADKPEEFLSRFIAAGQALRQFTGPGPVATDDKPLGFLFDERSIAYLEADRLTKRVLDMRQPISARLTNLGKTQADRNKAMERLQRAHDAAGMTIAAKHMAWRGDLAQAARLFAKIMRQFPDDKSARFNAARTTWEASRRLFEAGWPREAMAAANQALALDPNLAEPHELLGRVFEALGKEDIAAQEYRRALKLKPSLVRARQGLRRVARPLPANAP